MAETGTSDLDSGVSRERLIAALGRDFSLGASVAWRSHDPWDLLLSPFARRIPQVSPLAARVVLQLGRRSGVGLRRLLRVPLHEEPKTLADFLQAAVILGRVGEAWSDEYVSGLSSRLRQKAVPTRSGYGWGMAFPYASRFISVPADEPNIYTTTAACQALLDDYALTGREESLEKAVLGTRFIFRDLGSFGFQGNSWLRYFASTAGPIVNVQASASSLFARVGGIRRDDELLEAADRAAQTVVATQREDGSWTYSVDGRGDFVDGFHTGFTLQGLVEYGALRRAGESVVVDSAVAAGFAYFKEHLLTGDGRPRGFADGAPSRDGQTLAQAIQTLVVCGRGSDAAAAAGRVWLLNDEELRKARFLALRWSVAPFALATAYLVRAVTGS
jgi:polysaccharide biosynthesis protein VpsJ